MYLRHIYKDQQVWQDLGVHGMCCQFVKCILLNLLSGEPEVKSRSVSSQPSGYYYQDLWRALGGTTIRQFNTTSAISQCLRDKKVYLYGDSTIRQWFEHLSATLPGS